MGVHTHICTQTSLSFFLRALLNGWHSAASFLRFLTCSCSPSTSPWSSCSLASLPSTSPCSNSKHLVSEHKGEGSLHPPVFVPAVIVASGCLYSAGPTPYPYQQCSHGNPLEYRQNIITITPSPSHHHHHHHTITSSHTVLTFNSSSLSFTSP